MENQKKSQSNQQINHVDAPAKTAIAIRQLI
jgi:hypothetical protein